jgi:hypothetical protein
VASFSKVYDIKNLRRAYRWVLSNPDARYKNYFRNDYAAFALASETNLKFLSRQIRGGRFTPSHASKIYVPKANGILRPLSLLTVNDQIAYQACVNIVAENIHKRTKHRHSKTVFYHLYAGRSSPFFYLRWEQCYLAYANAVRRHFSAGRRYIATFDLTAFYDSIDHHVLKTFLKRSGADADTIAFLTSNLKHWTEATWSSGRSPMIFQEHGIPQGPLCSGMLSEVVLQHFDSIGDGKSKDFAYLRYVDDIKIMAKDEKTLRRKLVALDLAAKEIGLFPQGSKIAIRKISDPEKEIKSVSVPPEPAAKPFATQQMIRARVRLLANRGNPEDSTRFKYVLPRLIPSAKTNKLIYGIVGRRPDLSGAVIRHLSAYKKLPKSLSEQVVSDACDDDVYHAVNAERLDLLYGRISGAHLTQVADFAYERVFASRFRRKGIPSPQPTYKSWLIKWALLSTRMTYRDIESLIKGEADWWVRLQILSNLDEGRIGAPNYTALINLGIRGDDPDPARLAASIAFDHSLKIGHPYQECHWSARLLLRNVGAMPYSGRPPSLIPGILNYTVQFSQSYDWRRYFGVDHTGAERLAIVAKQRFETDIDAFVVSLDSFCDLVLRNVYTRRGHTMKASYGNALKAGAPTWLRADFPNLLVGFSALHSLRIRSFTAHPRHTTGAPNTRIKHRQFYRIRKSILLAFEELARVLPT